MIQLPVIRELDIDGFGMYPGSESKPGLHVTFQPGLTLVLGANGLGKTTLITIVFRMLTGPADVPALTERGTVGNKKLEARRFQYAWEKRIFANRVGDGAIDATATLCFTLGVTEMEVTRRLDTLALTSLHINGEETKPTEDAYTGHVTEHAGMSSFDDWLLILRLLTFYSEDRRALVWDQTAQRELLRLLFLPPQTSRMWTQKHREILELDSLVRNLQYALNKEVRLLGKAETARGSAPEIRQKLGLLSAIQDDELRQLSDLEDALADATAERQEARVAALTAEDERESAMRTLERLQLRMVESAFPHASLTARYIIGQILSDERCLTCGTEVPEFALVIRRRLEASECPVCSSDMTSRYPRTRVSGKRLGEAKLVVQQAEERATTTAKLREEAETAYDTLLDQISSLNATTARRAADLNDLIKQLPPDEQTIQEKRAGIMSDRVRLEEHKRHLDKLRVDFKKLQDQTNRAIAAKAEAVTAAFRQFVEGFLFEDCYLVWSLYRDRIGETGGLVEFPAFQLDLTGASFPSPVRRTGPGQVSESQREFIDLSFKMALMLVASEGGGTLVVDAPESSLDAVFVTRAANVLTRYAKSERQNRLLITSNLIDGNLIPTLLSKSDIRSERNSRIVDLLNIAAPTAATANMHDEYVAVRRALFDKARRDAE
jgi:hypothetical protein